MNWYLPYGNTIAPIWRFISLASSVIAFLRQPCPLFRKVALFAIVAVEPGFCSISSLRGARLSALIEGGK